MKKDKNILYVILFIIGLIWSFINVADAFINPVRIEDLTVEERIRYEQMIFP